MIGVGTTGQDQQQSAILPSDFKSTIQSAAKKADRSAPERFRDSAKKENAVTQAPADLPDLENLVYVSSPHAVSFNVMYFVTRVNGREVVTVVDGAKTPDLLSWAGTMSFRFSEAFGRYDSTWGWRVEPRNLNDVTDMKPPPQEEAAPADPSDHTEGGKYHEADKQPSRDEIVAIEPSGKFPGVVRYELKKEAMDRYGGHRFFFVLKDKNPSLYGYLSDTRDVRAAQEKVAGSHFIATDKTTVPPYDDIRPGSIKPVILDDGREAPACLVYELKSGDRIFVTDESNPALFSRLKSYTGAGDLIDAGQPDHTDGGKYLEADKQPVRADILVVGHPDQFPGIIRYEIKQEAMDRYGGHRFFFVSKDKDPAIYGYVADARDVLLAHNKVSGTHIIADDQTTVPPYSDIRPGTVKPVMLDDGREAPGCLVYELKSGEKVFVTNESNPTLFEQVGRYRSAEGTLGIDDTPDHTDGGKYRETDTQPVRADIISVGPANEFPGIVRYEVRKEAMDRYDGYRYFFVSEEKNPTQYRYISDTRDVIFAQNKVGGDHIIANDTMAAPHYTQIRPGSIKPVTLDDGREAPACLVYELKNGDKVFVTDESNPAMFSRMSGYRKVDAAIGESELPILADGAIYNEHIAAVELNRDGKALPPGMLIVELKRHPTFGDGRYVVADGINSQAYDTALSWHTNGAGLNTNPVSVRGDQNDIRYGGQGRTDAREFEERFGLERGDWDVLSAETEVRIDEKNSSSRMLTVGELAMKRLRASYEEKSKTDPKAAKFIAILDAVAAYSSGRQISAYSQGAVSAISGDYYVPSEDWQEVLDYDRLMKESNAIWQDDAIQAEYATIVSDILGKLDGASRKERAQKLHDVIVGPGGEDSFAQWLFQMKAEGREGEAELIVQNTWSSLALLDQADENGNLALVESAQREFQTQVMIGELSAVTEQGLTDDEYSDLAIQDNVNYILSIVRSVPNIARLSPRVIEFLEGVLNGKISAPVFKDIINTLKGASENGVFTFSDEKINELFAGKSYSMEDQGKVVHYIRAMNSVGLLGSLVGGITLASGIYRLVKGKNETTEDRLLIARDFLAFVTYSEHFGKLGASLFKFFPPDAIAMMGLDSSLPEIWGRDGRWGKKLPPPPTSAIDILQSVSDAAKMKWDDMYTMSKDRYEKFYNSLSDEAKASHSAWVEKLNKDSLRAGLPPQGLGNRAWRIVGSVFKVLGNGFDAVTGVVDIVFNALKLSKAKDPATVTSGVFGLLGGTLSAGAGTIVGVNALVRTLSFAALSSPLFIAGMVLGVVSVLIELFSGQRATDETLNKQREWLGTLDDAGVMRDDWGKAYEFMNTWYAFGQGRNDLYDLKDDIPNGLSVFDFDRERWDRFRNEWEPGEEPHQEGFFTDEELKSWYANHDRNHVFEWDFSERNHNSGDKLAPDHPARKALEQSLDDLAIWYSGNINTEERRLSLFTNDVPRKAIEKMADFYLNYIDANADSKIIGEWIMKELAPRVEDAFEGDKGKARDIFDNYFFKSDRTGRADMTGIIEGVYNNGTSPRPGLESTLNSIVSIYADGGIDIDTRGLFSFTSDKVRPQFEKLIVFYFEEVNSKGSAKDAAQWAIDQLKDRIGQAYGDKPSKDDKTEIDIFMNYVNKDNRDGKRDAETVAETVLGKVEA